MLVTSVLRSACRDRERGNLNHNIVKTVKMVKIVSDDGKTLDSLLAQVMSVHQTQYTAFL